MPGPAVEVFKVVLLGEGRVGKTSLAVRYVHGTFDDGQQATIQASFMTKRSVVDDQQVELAIWDTAGQERFHALGPIYYRDAHAALLVFDVTDAASFERVRAWVRELRALASPTTVLAIAANKQDLAPRRRAVPDEVSRAFAASIGAAYFQTSALTGAGLEPAFSELARRALAARRAAATESAVQHQAGMGLSRRQGALVLQEDAPPPAKQSSCC